MRMLLMTIVALVGCAPSGPAGEPDQPIDLTVEPDPVEPGDTVTLVLDNGSEQTLGYNLCTSQLERRAGDEWQPVASDRVCTMELRILTPGDEARYPIPLASDLEAGEYRFVARVEVQGRAAMEDIASPPFRIG